jgi:hypothetical protein
VLLALAGLDLLVPDDAQAPLALREARASTRSPRKVVMGQLENRSPAASEGRRHGDGHRLMMIAC